MVQIKPRSLYVPVLALALGGCAAAVQDTRPAPAVQVCEEPRPQVCTMDYRPVCARLEDDSTKSFSNGCGACADAAVVSWVENACPE